MSEERSQLRAGILAQARQAAKKFGFMIPEHGTKVEWFHLALGMAEELRRKEEMNKEKQKIKQILRDHNFWTNSSDYAHQIERMAQYAAACRKAVDAAAEVIKILPPEREYRSDDDLAKIKAFEDARREVYIHE